jgi:glycine/betaine/sarcosine/D-proline reductase family selenoprotein B
MLYEGSLDELARQYRDWLASAKPLLEAHDFATAFKTYPFVRNERAPWTPVAKPLSDSLVALVSTGGFYVRGEQAPFDAANIEGDTSYRTFSRTVAPSQLGIAHDHFPHRYAEADINVILPLDHLSAFEGEGLIGECEDTVYSITGYLTDAAAFMRTTAPEIAQRLQETRADVALIIPV